MTTASLAVKKVKGMGLGVFTMKPIKSGAIVLIDHCIHLSEADLQFASKTVLKNYYYEGEGDDKTALLALGMASLINHSFKAPNVTHEWDETDAGYTITFTALRNIEAGEQIFFDYDFDEDKIPDWADNPKTS